MKPPTVLKKLVKVVIGFCGNDRIYELAPFTIYPHPAVNPVEIGHGFRRRNKDERLFHACRPPRSNFRQIDLG